MMSRQSHLKLPPGAAGQAWGESKFRVRQPATRDPESLAAVNLKPQPERRKPLTVRPPLSFILMIMIPGRHISRGVERI